MKYVCTICGYIYDETKEKIKFNDLPEDWTCPLCGAPKSAFELLLAEDTTELAQSQEMEETHKIETLKDMKKISYGELSIICSNLAKACEKQYKFQEEKLFKEIAQYFEKNTSMPKEKEINKEKLFDIVEEDLTSNFVKTHNMVDKYEDRGAKRAIVWSEKVTRMIASLLNAYEKQGEKMFKDKEIWICTVCGFIYVGDKLPERCPVCKVTNSKFMKIDGRFQI